MAFCHQIAVSLSRETERTKAQEINRHCRFHSEDVTDFPYALSKTKWQGVTGSSSAILRRKKEDEFRTTFFPFTVFFRLRQ